MSILTRLKNFLISLFQITDSEFDESDVPMLTDGTSKGKYQEISNKLTAFANELDEYSGEETDLDSDLDQDNAEKFSTRNIIFEKLNYLEQYIKVFSLNFPEEYEKYSKLIHEKKTDYEQELKNYQSALDGNITFSIDPEAESKRLIDVKALEDQITEFVEYTVNYSVYVSKFSSLCSKLNQFYNALLNTKRNDAQISSQLNNAVDSMCNLINEVKALTFFDKDSRKREKILEFVIYGEYIFLKTALRCCIVKNFDDFKYSFSKFYKLFVSTEYDRFLFKYFINDLEQYQIYITSELSNESSYEFLLKTCEDLQSKLNDYRTFLSDTGVFTSLVQFENTIESITKGTFSVSLPKGLNIEDPVEEDNKVIETAASVLSIIESDKAMVLRKVIEKFNYAISWREFFFLCKIFELDEQVIKHSENTLFDFVKSKFDSFYIKYPEYSSSFIADEKRKILNYNGSKPKKYILLWECADDEFTIFIRTLKLLELDFIVSDKSIYLNHTYFCGFKNLNKNFGNYKKLEDL